MNWLKWSTPPADIDIEFDDEVRRERVSVRASDAPTGASDVPNRAKRERIVLYQNGESVSGKVNPTSISMRNEWMH
jgi:hypothetical protein